MKNLKSILVGFFASTLVVFSCIASQAEEFGVVDLDRVLSGYSKAQDISADLKVKEAELQKFIADAQKQIKDAKTPLEKKNLEDSLSKDFQVKTTDYRNMQANLIKQVEDSVNTAIKTVSTTKKINVVLNKSAVILGGTDLTEQVLSTLNVAKK